MGPLHERDGESDDTELEKDDLGIPSTFSARESNTTFLGSWWYIVQRLSTGRWWHVEDTADAGKVNRRLKSLRTNLLKHLRCLPRRFDQWLWCRSRHAKPAWTRTAFFSNSKRRTSFLRARLYEFPVNPLTDFRMFQTDSCILSPTKTCRNLPNIL